MKGSQTNDADTWQNQFMKQYSDHPDATVWVVDCTTRIRGHEHVIRQLLQRHPDAVLITHSEREAQKFRPDERVHNQHRAMERGGWPVRHGVDLVIVDEYDCLSAECLAQLLLYKDGRAIFFGSRRDDTCGHIVTEAVHAAATHKFDVPVRPAIAWITPERKHQLRMLFDTDACIREFEK